MTVKERMAAIRLAETIGRQPKHAAAIGVKVCNAVKKGGVRKRLHHCRNEPG